MTDTRRLRHLFEQMDRRRVGYLTVADFKGYVARAYPRGAAKAPALFRVMAAKCGDDDDAAGGPVTLSFTDVRRPVSWTLF